MSNSIDSRYWAHYPAKRNFESGEAPTTVVRRRELPDRVYDESFRVWGGWAPTSALYDATDPRPSSVPHLVEISDAEADEVLAARFGIAAASQQTESAIQVPKLSVSEADSLRAHWDRAVHTDAETAACLDEILAPLTPTRDARRATEFASMKSLDSLHRQLAVMRSEGVSLPTALSTINDIVRYTLVFDTEQYTSSTELISALLARRGYTVVPGSEANSWSHSRYKDYRAVWTAPDSDIRIEIQFHTPPSLGARESNQHLHEFARQSELWPTTTGYGSAEFVRYSSWWCIPTSPENGQAVATLLGYGSIEEALRDLVAAPTRLAYLLDLPADDLRGLVQLRQLIANFARSPQLPHGSRTQDIATATNALTRALIPEIDDPDGTAEIFGVVTNDLSDAIIEVHRTARLLTASAIIHRGDLDDHPPLPTPAPPATAQGAVAAAVLGLPDTRALRHNPSRAAYRLAYLLGVPAHDPTALLVLSTLLETFVEKAYIPPLGHTDELVEETDRVAGAATPIDPDLYREAAAGFGLPDFLEDSSGIYRICSRAAVFLFKSVLIRSID
ncbi:hypothetical protein HLB23_21660 [Nocardia uniformis]|uniref:Uncharacterized protein n=1 Tax=Nocardia uniformis TaxID=53432 RepID=A0A849C0Z7_9NOCA|nr:hypothetical protein [Nocardia uniformis]NNH72433.1 hypothetical protein [Nocardia uniformis]